MIEGLLADAPSPAFGVPQVQQYQPIEKLRLVLSVSGCGYGLFGTYSWSRAC
jgi:hypothetical protein